MSKSLSLDMSGRQGDKGGGFFSLGGRNGQHGKDGGEILLEFSTQEDAVIVTSTLVKPGKKSPKKPNTVVYSLDRLPEDIRLRADGGKGGKGEVGSPGLSGNDGRDGKIGESGRSGTNGTRGGPGGNGGDGGNGGRVIVSVDEADTDMLMLFKTVPTASGGAGGDPGPGGSGGRAGQGGAAGAAGSTYTWEGHTRIETTHYAGLAGRSGVAGGNGRAGKKGNDGKDGSLVIQVVGSSTREYLFTSVPPYDLRVDLEKTTFSSVWCDDVIEPGCLCNTWLVVENVGTMPTPLRQKILFSHPCSAWFECLPENHVEIDSQLKAGELRHFAQPISWHVRALSSSSGSGNRGESLDFPALPLVGNPLKVHVPMRYNALVPRVNLPLQHIQQNQESTIVVHFPVYLSTILSHIAPMRGSETPIVCFVDNHSKFSLGSASQGRRALTVVLSGTIVSACSTNLSDPPTLLPVPETAFALYTVNSDRIQPHSLPLSGGGDGHCVGGGGGDTNSVTSFTTEYEILLAEPGSTLPLLACLAIDPIVPYYTQISMAVVMQLGKLEDHALLEAIQRRDVELQVSEPFPLEQAQACQVLLITNQRTTAGEVRSWHKLCATVGQKCCTWNIDLYNGVRFNAPLSNGCTLRQLFAGKMVVILNNERVFDNTTGHVPLVSGRQVPLDGKTQQPGDGNLFNRADIMQCIVESAMHVYVCGLPDGVHPLLMDHWMPPSDDGIPGIQKSVYSSEFQFRQRYRVDADSVARSAATIKQERRSEHRAVSVMADAGDASPVAATAFGSVPPLQKGFMKKRGGFDGTKAFKRRFWILDAVAGTLSYFEDTVSKVCLGEIPLHGAAIELDSENSENFKLITGAQRGGRVFFLRVDATCHERSNVLTRLNPNAPFFLNSQTQWMDAIKHVIAASSFSSSCDMGEDKNVGCGPSVISLDSESSIATSSTAAAIDRVGGACGDHGLDLDDRISEISEISESESDDDCSAVDLRPSRSGADAGSGSIVNDDTHAINVRVSRPERGNPAAPPCSDTLSLDGSIMRHVCLRAPGMRGEVPPVMHQWIGCHVPFDSSSVLWWPADFVASGDFAGMLQKRGVGQLGGGWRKRWFVLRPANKTLSYYSSHKSLKANGVIALRTFCLVQGVPGELQIETPTRTYYLADMPEPLRMPGYNPIDMWREQLELLVVCGPPRRARGDECDHAPLPGIESVPKESVLPQGALRVQELNSFADPRATSTLQRMSLDGLHDACQGWAGNGETIACGDIELVNKNMYAKQQTEFESKTARELSVFLREQYPCLRFCIQLISKQRQINVLPPTRHHYATVVFRQASSAQIHDPAFVESRGNMFSFFKCWHFSKKLFMLRHLPDDLGATSPYGDARQNVALIIAATVVSDLADEQACYRHVDETHVVTVRQWTVELLKQRGLVLLRQFCQALFTPSTQLYAMARGSAKRALIESILVSIMLMCLRFRSFKSSLLTTVHSVVSDATCDLLQSAVAKLIFEAGETEEAAGKAREQVQITREYERLQKLAAAKKSLEKKQNITAEQSFRLQRDPFPAPGQQLPPFSSIAIKLGNSIVSQDKREPIDTSQRQEPIHYAFDSAAQRKQRLIEYARDAPKVFFTTESDVISY